MKPSGTAPKGATLSRGNGRTGWFLFLCLLISAAAVWISADCLFGFSPGFACRTESPADSSGKTGIPDRIPCPDRAERSHRAARLRRAVTVPGAVGNRLTDGSVLYDPDGHPTDLSPFDLHVIGVHDRHAPEGTVLRQSLPAGTRFTLPASLAEGQRPSLVLVVSLGRRTVTVPDLTGQESRAAVLGLQSRNLSAHVELAGDGEPTGGTGREHARTDSPTVLWMSPPPGTELTEGERVTLYVSSPKPGNGFVLCPDVVGMSLPEARRVLTGCGLSVGRVSVRTRIATGTTTGTTTGMTTGTATGTTTGTTAGTTAGTATGTTTGTTAGTTNGTDGSDREEGETPDSSPGTDGTDRDVCVWQSVRRHTYVPSGTAVGLTAERPVRSDIGERKPHLSRRPERQRDDTSHAIRENAYDLHAGRPDYQGHGRTLHRPSESYPRFPDPA